MHTKWKTRASNIVHKNPFYQVVQHEVTRSNGTPGTYYVVDRYGPFGIIIPLFPDGTTLLVGQYRYATQYYSWEFPMGSVKGKKPQEQAEQELKEETGYSAHIWNELGSFYIGNGHTNQEGFVFTAQDLIAGDASPEPGELLEVKRVPIASVGTMILEGKIKDSPTISAYYLYAASNDAL